MILAFLLLFSPPEFAVGLPNFPNYDTEYHYTIKMPAGATHGAVLWYYGTEHRNNLIYNSGAFPVRYGVVRTEMYFPKPGRYVLVVLAQQGTRILKHRQTYKVVALL